MTMFDSGKHKRDAHGRWSQGGGGALPKVKQGTREHHDQEATKHATKSVALTNAAKSQPRGSQAHATMSAAAKQHAGFAVAHAQASPAAGTGTGVAENQAHRAMQAIEHAHDTGHPSSEYFDARDKSFGKPIVDTPEHPSSFQWHGDDKAASKTARLKRAATYASNEAHAGTGSHEAAQAAHQAVADHMVEHGDYEGAQTHIDAASRHYDQGRSEARADKRSRTAAKLDPSVDARRAAATNAAHAASRHASARSAESDAHGLGSETHQAKLHASAASAHREAAEAHRAAGDRVGSQAHERLAVEHDRESARHTGSIGRSSAAKKLLKILDSNKKREA